MPFVPEGCVLIMYFRSVAKLLCDPVTSSLLAAPDIPDSQSLMWQYPIVILRGLFFRMVVRGYAIRGLVVSDL